jgi:hypothetical protein
MPQEGPACLSVEGSRLDLLVDIALDGADWGSAVPSTVEDHQFVTEAEVGK